MITARVGKKPIQKPNSFRDAIEAKKKAFIEVSMQIIVEDITQGIGNGVAVSGGPLPKLEASTIARKGHAQPLVDEGYLSRQGTYEQINQSRLNKGIIRIRAVGAVPRNKVGPFLQLDGVGYGPGRRKKKYFNFFGISRDAAGRMNDLLDSIMADILKDL